LSPRLWHDNGVKAKASSVALKDQVQAKTRSLLSPPDPGVRGYAAEAAANLHRRDADASLIAALEGMLTDTHAFPRATAAKALGTLKSTSSIHVMIPLLDDSASCTYDIRGWKNLYGRDDRAHHDCSAWSMVNDAVVQAIQAASAGMGGAAFKAEMVNLKTKDADIARNVAAAGAWYAANKGNL